ncbi:MAG: PEP/pyruvate-binding domain-containing protein [Microthrixaceae bacterium]
MTADEVATGQGFDGTPLVIWLDEIAIGDTAIAGHKSVNLSRVRAMAEVATMTLAEPAGPGQPDHSTIAVPDGFVVTTRASSELLKAEGLRGELDRLGAQHLSGAISARGYSDAARGLVAEASVPGELRSAISKAYDRLSLSSGVGELVVAVRSSAAMEDSIGASFAGQFDSVLGVRTIDELFQAYLKVIASSLSLRALSYRKAVSGQLGRPGRLERPGDLVRSVSEMSVLVQRMVRSDRGSAGVVMTSVADPEEPHISEPVTVLEVVPGTGEGVVGGATNPESLVVRLADNTVTRTPSSPPESVSILADAIALELAGWGRLLEVEFGSPVQIEWARDGVTGELAVVQVRPIPDPTEAVGLEHSRSTVELKSGLKVLTRGLAIGSGVVSGPAVVVDDPLDLLAGDEVDHLPEQFILVVATTSPEWVPLMRLASALVTDYGGRGSHAAIVCRELALPAVLGCGDATNLLRTEKPQLDGDRAVQPEDRAFRPVVVICDERAGGEVWG